MLSILQIVVSLARKSGETIDFIKEHLGITMEAEEQLLVIDGLRTSEDVAEFIKTMHSQPEIVQTAAWKQWEYLTDFDSVNTEIRLCDPFKDKYVLDTTLMYYVRKIK